MIGHGESKQSRFRRDGRTKLQKLGSSQEESIKTNNDVLNDADDDGNDVRHNDSDQDKFDSLYGTPQSLQVLERGRKNNKGYSKL